MVWPHMERMPAIQHYTGFDPVPKDKFPKLNRWLEAMKETPGVKATIISTENHIKFIESVKEKKPNYDI